MIQPIEQLDEFWAAEYPDCPPVAFTLKWNYPERWVRFHSLPDSRRYPENEAELQTVLQRHNKILDVLTRGPEPLVLVTVAYSSTEQPTDRDEALQTIDPGAQHWRVVSTLEDDEPQDEPGDGDFWHLFASERVWRVGVFDDLLRLVAKDQVANVMLISTDRRFVYHPYDGGADVLLPTQADRDALKAAYSGWLSEHPRGM